MLALVKRAASTEAAFFVPDTFVELIAYSKDRGDVMHSENRLAYWRANLRLVALCLAIWFVCSYGFGVLLVEQMNHIRLGGFRLGFWFAQQGSIYVFVALIFFYAWRMNRIDEKYDVHED